MRHQQLSEQHTQSYTNREASFAQLLSSWDNISAALEAFDEGVHIFRGIGEASPVRYQPTLDVGVRKMGWTFHGMLMDESPAWIGYPSRDSSVIATNNQEYAQEYALEKGLYLVLPEHDPMVGICPARDLWESFPNLTNHLKISILDELNWIIRDLFSKFLKLPSWGTKNYDELKQKFHELDQVLAQLPDKSPRWLAEQGLTDEQINLLELAHGQPLLGVIQDLMKPSANGFSRARLSELPGKLTGDHELWFTAPIWMLHLEKLPAGWKSWNSRKLKEHITSLVE